MMEYHDTAITEFDTIDQPARLLDEAITILATGAVLRLSVCERSWNTVPLDALRRQLFGYLQASGCERVVFDLAATDCWPRGIVGMWHTIQQNGIGVHVMNLPQPIDEAMHLAGLDRRFSVVRKEQRS